MAELPNLAGIATQDLVETIGTGSFKASYINWARTCNLFHKHAPGWYGEMVPCPTGGWVHPAPGVGGFLMITITHIDGTTLPACPQSIMDNRNNAIPLEKITARDITDTHRRGFCLAMAMHSGLGIELWAKMPLESGYLQAAEYKPQETGAPLEAPTEASKAPTAATEQDFLAAAKSKGLTTESALALLAKIGTNYSGGIKTLYSKNEGWVASTNNENKPKEKVAVKKNQANPEDY